MLGSNPGTCACQRSVLLLNYMADPGICQNIDWLDRCWSEILRVDTEAGLWLRSKVLGQKGE